MASILTPEQREISAERRRQKMKGYNAKHRAKSKLLPPRPLSEKTIAYRKEWMSRNKDKTSAASKRWRAKNREYFRQYERQKWATDAAYRVGKTFRSRTRNVLRYAGAKKCRKAFELLGCSVEEFRTHLESLFSAGMTWENYGTYWEIDHIKPCTSFNLLLPEHQEKCFHFSNQQPLTVPDNRRKYNKIVLC
jgi:hypothetical protein